MAQEKYLYGAAVQGIQNFIFQTNTLREIAGASELVEQICTTKFAEAIHSSEDKLKNDPNAIITAAGNIKYVFDNEQRCKDIVLRFPKKVMEFAPGITISQAVVKVEGEISKTHIDELERLLRAQRNRALRPSTLGLIGIERSRKTGLPAVSSEIIKGEETILDQGSKAKRDQKNTRVVKALMGEAVKIERIPWEMEEITQSKSNSYSWMAVVHADGNNMGLALQQLAKATQDKKGYEFIRLFREFSLKLDEATKQAAYEAYKSTYNAGEHEHKKLPFRPIVIGGDDLTVICRGDLALQFTQNFLSEFEKQTREKFQHLAQQVDFLRQGLTACAGIAYIKESYPFHYGYHLAETLCTEAKTEAKTGLPSGARTPSCLMFHKVQDSFVDDFKTIRKRELRAGAIRFDFGPYYLESTQKQPTIERLQVCVANLKGKEGNAIKSHLRQWLTDLHQNPELAEQKKRRVISVHKTHLKQLNLDNANKWTETRTVKEDNEVKNVPFTPIYDWLTIHSIHQ